MAEPQPAASQHSGRVLSLSAFSEELATRLAATKLFVVVAAVKPLIAFNVQSREEEAVFPERFHSLNAGVSELHHKELLCVVDVRTKEEEEEVGDSPAECSQPARAAEPLERL